MVENHLYQNGIDSSYNQWIFHGEDPFTTNNMHVEHTPNNASVEDLDEIDDLLNDIRRGTFSIPNMGDSSTTQGPTTNDYEHRTSFDPLCEDAHHELYPGCKQFSKLSFIVNMIHIKTLCNMSNKAFNMMIDLMRRALPNGETLPRLYYEAKQFRQGLGFRYESIHACKNDCVLFWKEYADKEECPLYKTSRWSSVKSSSKKIP
jgi:hypothetical protein